MRLPLANTLKTRSGDHLKDARNVNGYPDIKEGQAIVRKRPGCNPTSFNFTTPLQGFSSIADLMTYLPYGNYGDISTLMFSVYGDYYYINQLWWYRNGTPLYDPLRTYNIGDSVWYAIGAYNGSSWLEPDNPEYPKPEEWRIYHAYESGITTRPLKTDTKWGLAEEYRAVSVQYYAGTYPAGASRSKAGACSNLASELTATDYFAQIGRRTFSVVETDAACIINQCDDTDPGEDVNWVCSENSYSYHLTSVPGQYEPNKDAACKSAGVGSYDYETQTASEPGVSFDYRSIST